MGANFTKESITRAARSVSTLVSVGELFDKATGIHPESTAHSSHDKSQGCEIVQNPDHH